MQTRDALVVGGGPAGSTCAWKLCEAGLDVLVLDKAVFPRHKVCAGWITPVVFEELQIDPADYGRGRVLQPLTSFRTGQIGGPQIQTDYAKAVSYGVRRCEFDDYLLRRSGARLQLGERVKTVRRSGDGWVIDDRHRAPLLVAAGGHFCPVARFLGGDGRAAGPLIAAQEIEFELDARQKDECTVRPGIPELYFCHDLKGYGWCIRKGDFLNVGLGREDRHGLPRQVADFCGYLGQEGKIPRQIPGKFRGHAYLLYARRRRESRPGESQPRKLLDDGVVVLGDSAGLAYPQSGEGIRPAVESALIAAEVILAAGGDYGRDRLEPYRQLLSRRLGKGAGSSRGLVPSGVRRLIGRRLLSSRRFTRHVVLDRWFLHASDPPLGQDP